MISVVGSILLLAPAVVMDVRKKRLPLVFLAVFGAAGIVVNLCFENLKWPDIAAGVAVGGLFLLISKITREQIAYGDGVLVGSLGAWIGGGLLSGAVLIGLLSGGAFGLFLILIRKRSRKHRLPFAPFLSFGCGIMLILNFFS